MARPLRVEYPGAFYHVFNRGVEHRTVFTDRKSYEAFLARLEALVKPLGLRAHSYALLPNHYHLYLETPRGNLSQIMQRLEGPYTQFFNAKHQRVGPLFQGRYQAILVEKESYSLEISRYIHLNPVKAGLARSPEDYEWSSYRAFLGREKPRAFLETDWLLAQFGETVANARVEFEKFTREGLGEAWDPFKEAKGGSLLGKESFLKQMQEAFLPRQKDRSLSRLNELQRELPGPVTPEVLREALKRWVQDSREQRKFLIYCLRSWTPMALKEIGQVAGGMSEVAVSQACKRFKAELDEKDRLSEILGRIQAEVFPVSNVEP